jgi:hypothetical protein
VALLSCNGGGERDTHSLENNVVSFHLGSHFEECSSGVNTLKCEFHFLGPSLNISYYSNLLLV